MTITRILSRFWQDNIGISSVEYALLLAFVAAGIIVAADSLSNAVSNEMEDAVALFDEDTCGNDGGGDGTGGGGAGQGGANTC